MVVNIISECKVIIKNSLWSAKNKNRNKFYIILTRKAFEVEVGSIVSVLSVFSVGRIREYSIN